MSDLPVNITRSGPSISFLLGSDIKHFRTTTLHSINRFSLSHGLERLFNILDPHPPPVTVGPLDRPPPSQIWGQRTETLLPLHSLEAVLILNKQNLIKVFIFINRLFYLINYINSMSQRFYLLLLTLMLMSPAVKIVMRGHHPGCGLALN